MKVHIAVFNIDNQQGPMYSAENSAQRYVSAWTGGASGGDWIHVHAWLSPLAAHMKASQCC